jgi:uncharacterized glyoxalase superfamily protein PhnB
MEAPAHYLPIMPYIIVPKAYDFISFIKAVFNAEEMFLLPREEGIIMHAEYKIGKGCIMFCDATDDYLAFPCSMFLFIDNVEDLYQKGLANGATSLQDIAEREYGKSAGFKDAFGNAWWLTEPSK